jgi:hypothetical protein
VVLALAELDDDAVMGVCWSVDARWRATPSSPSVGCGRPSEIPSAHKYGNMGLMKTTLDIPDVVFRKAKSKAAERGQTLREFVSEALEEKLASRSRGTRSGEPAWMQGFGKLKHLRKETARIQERIDEAFDVVEPEDRA